MSGATHRCKVCGSTWRKHEPKDGGGWSLVKGTLITDVFPTGRAGDCCDNVAMGDQIEPLCNRMGCESVGTLRPVIEVRSKLAPDYPMPITLSLCLCAPHSLEESPERMIVDETWQSISDAINAMGYERPDRELTTLRFVPWVAEEEPRRVAAEALKQKTARVEVRRANAPRNPFRRN